MQFQRCILEWCDGCWGSLLATNQSRDQHMDRHSTDGAVSSCLTLIVPAFCRLVKKLGMAPKKLGIAQKAGNTFCS